MKAIARRLGLTRERLTPFRWFDYLALNPDLRAAGITTRQAARRHYRTVGRYEERRWYVPWPREMLRGLSPCDPTDGGWQAPPASLAGPRRSLEHALSCYPTEQWAIAAARAAFDRPPRADTLDDWCTLVDTAARSRLSVYAEARGLRVVHDPHRCDDHPDEQRVTGDWFDCAEEVCADLSDARRAAWSARGDLPSAILSPTPTVSVLCSLYRSDALLDLLLGNIVEQTIFADCEFIMVAVEPSAFERDLLERATRSHPNIRLDIVPRRIGIYAAWNRAARAARGRYLTNMNADDLRRVDSLERQRDLLEAWPWVDVVTQDVVVTHDPRMSWDAIERIGARTHYPPTTLAAFLSYLNPPHNGPMWRRSLHDRFGWFDERFESAGDSDFWMRCARGGAHFAKDHALHVAYFDNPDGLSSSPDSTGPVEHRAIVSAHVDLLPIGPAPHGVIPPTPGSPPIPRADRVTRTHLARLASCAPPSAGRPTDGRRIVLDAHAVAVGTATTFAVWRELLASWSPERLAVEGIELLVLDRSGALVDLPHRVVPFPERAWNTTQPAADRDALCRACEHLHADLFVTSSHTFPLRTPFVALDPTGHEWVPSIAPSPREALEAELASMLGVAIGGSDPEQLLAALIDTLAAPPVRPPEATAILMELHHHQLEMQR